MDNKKIGKLIATLRNKEGLTQQELGDKIGVGFRAVSKWERGLNLPDIGNMTELSKIFGITLDELMAGELKQEEENKPKKKISPKIKITISIITTILIAIIITIISILIYSRNKIYIYDMVSTNKDKYYIEGQVTFQRNGISVKVNKLEFIDTELRSTIVENYEYKVYSNNLFIFGYGYTSTGSHIEKATTIGEIISKLRINYNDELELKRDEFIESKIVIIINFLQEDNKEITEEIEISLLPTT